MQALLGAHGQPVLMLYVVTKRVLLTAIAAFAMTLVGCATYQGPRIDPTGERLFVWPGQAPPPGAVVVAPPGTVAPGPAVVTVPIGNMQAPPVYSDPTPPALPPAAAVIPPVPYAPSTAIPGTVAQACPVSTITPAVPVVTPVAGAGPAVTVPPGSTFVRLTPDRLVAPVGTEVFLKAGVLSADGALSPNERIEWSVARNGVGQIGTMGTQESGHLLSWWVAPEKIDPWTAVGRTAYHPVTVSSNTPGPFGQAQVERGESYVTLTSCSEGVSQVTASAPDLCQFNQATTSIYWIDAQWTFPASAVAACGQPQTLTTTIFRRTNGAPLCGWVVRYTVGGGGSLGSESGSTIDARTDASGRASVQVSPSQAGGGVTQVGVTIIHPQAIGPNALPQVELARGAAAITWTTNGAVVAPAVPVVPLGPTSAPSTPGLPMMPAPLGAPPATIGVPPSSGPAPTLPTTPQSPPPTNSSTAAPNPYSPPPAGKPKLELSLRATTPEQIAVGQYVSYELTITNRGDGVARNIQVIDQFDRGLSHIGDTRKEHVVKNANIRELAPNDSERIPLTFQLIDAGQQCHRVTVTADGAEPAQQQACVTGSQASLEVKISGEHTRIVGDTTIFTVTVRNTGTTAASNVELRVAFDQAIEPILEAGMERLQDGSVLVRLNGDLAPGEKRSSLRLQGRCRMQSTHACARAAVTAMGGATSQDEACLEILPANPAGAPGAAPR